MGFKEFADRVRSDKAFAAKFQGLTDVAQVVALAKAEGYEISDSDFHRELSDEELDKVAGGDVNVIIASNLVVTDIIRTNFPNMVKIM